MKYIAHKNLLVNPPNRYYGSDTYNKLLYNHINHINNYLLFIVPWLPENGYFITQPNSLLIKLKTNSFNIVDTILRDVYIY